MYQCMESPDNCVLELALTHGLAVNTVSRKYQITQ